MRASVGGLWRKATQRCHDAKLTGARPGPEPSFHPFGLQGSLIVSHKRMEQGKEHSAAKACHVQRVVDEEASR